MAPIFKYKKLFSLKLFFEIQSENKMRKSWKFVRIKWKFPLRNFLKRSFFPLRSILLRTPIITYNNCNQSRLHVSRPVLRHRKFRTRKFCENFGTKDWIYQKCRNIFQNVSTSFKNFGKMKILESIVHNYVHSQQIFWSLEKAHGGGEILPKVLSTILVSSKFHQNRNVH